MIVDSRCMGSPYLMRSQKWTYPSDNAKKAIVIATKMRSCMFKLLRGRSLPSSLFTAKPPDDSDGGRVLVLGENILGASKENRHIRPIAPVFVFHFKAVGDGEIIGRGNFFQRLRDSAEQSAAIGEIFRASAKVGP